MKMKSNHSTAQSKKKPNILLIAVDSLRADRMSCYGYGRLTTPHIDRFAAQSALFENTFSPHVPTTPAYASMLSGRDCFGTQVVALRHKGGLTDKIRTLPEILRQAGYTTTCVGFQYNPSSRGFDRYVDFSGWGSWKTGPARKAENLNAVALPELDRLSAGDQPWFAMLRHMDPHSPYLPPEPYNKLFYTGDPTSPALADTARAMFEFKPFADYFKTWMIPGLRDINWVDAQYDGAVAYMDACIGVVFQKLRDLQVLDDTIVVFNSDHGEILQEHQCWYDHHGMYDPNLRVPLMIRYPAGVPAGVRITGYNQHKDLVPTIMELAGVALQSGDRFDGASLVPMIRGEVSSHESEFYITECTWMRKHGWRTAQWKLIVALEPDFHSLPGIELYNLVEDPLERRNVAADNPDVVDALRRRMNQFIDRRKQETGIENPMLTQGDWANAGAPFDSSGQAYSKMYIGDPETAKKIQADENKTKKPPVSMRDVLPEAFRRCKRLVTIIGRGHSGTRAMSHTLSASGVFMGEPLNGAGDLLPPEDMYEACRVIARHVKYVGDLRWDFSALYQVDIDPAFTRLLGSYLSSVIDSTSTWRGWKIPETTLCYPWIVRLFPNMRYILWVRDPRDCILGQHVTDDLARFGVPVPAIDNIYERRALSWLYQAQIMRDTPTPAHAINVRFEDFVLRQPDVLKRLSAFLNLDLCPIPVKPEAVGRWHNHPDHRNIEFLQPTLKRLEYV